MVVSQRSNPENSKVGKFEFRDLSQTRLPGEHSPIPNLSPTIFDLRQKSLNLFLSPVLICKMGMEVLDPLKGDAVLSHILMISNKMISRKTHSRNSNEAELLIPCNSMKSQYVSDKRMLCLSECCLKQLLFYYINWVYFLTIQTVRIYMHISIPKCNDCLHPEYLYYRVLFQRSVLKMHTPYFCIFAMHCFTTIKTKTKLHVSVQGTRSRAVGCMGCWLMAPALGRTYRMRVLPFVLKPGHMHKIFLFASHLYQRISAPNGPR